MLFKKYLSKAVMLSVLVAGTLIAGQADALNIGVNSVDARSGGAVTQALENSRILRQQGCSELDIMQKTGWYQGADGKERYRIDDDIRYVDLSCVENKTATYKIKDLYKNPDFLRNYPQIANLTVKFDFPGTHGGDLKPGNGSDEIPNTDNAGNLVFGYNPDKVNGIDLTKGGYLRLNPDVIENDEFSKKIIVHEIQHAIQDAEGFAIDGNTKKLADFAKHYGPDEAKNYVKNAVGLDINVTPSTDFMEDRFVNSCYGRDYKGKLLDKIGNGSINGNDEGSALQKVIANSKNSEVEEFMRSYKNELDSVDSAYDDKEFLYFEEILTTLRAKYWSAGGPAIDYRNINDSNSKKVSDWMKQACDAQKNIPKTIRFAEPYLRKVDRLCNGNAVAPVRRDFYHAWAKAILSNNVQYLYDYFDKYDAEVLSGNGKTEIANDFAKMRTLLLQNGDWTYLCYLSIAGEYEANVTDNLMISKASKAEKDRIAFDAATKKNQLFATFGDTSRNYLTYSDFTKIRTSNIKVKGNIQKSTLEIFVQDAATGKTKSVGYYDQKGVAHGKLPISFKQAKNLYYGRP